MTEAAAAPVRRPRLATVWLDGCSGCHMSFLDLDERLIELVSQVDVVFTPLIDVKEFPTDVDVTLVEGAVGSEEDLARIQNVRANTRILVSFGDCAVNGNVPSYRNLFALDAVLGRAYLENADLDPQVPGEIVPRLLPRERPVHEVVPVDLFLPGCPPPADVIYALLTGLVAGEVPQLTALTRFGR
jgi:NAD-reducing hydrogenase small subunit